DLSLLDMLRIGWSFIGMSGDALDYEHFEYEATYIDGVSYVILDDNNINEVIQKMTYGMVLEDSSTDDYSNTYGY
ncbi:MAG: hypothetical protein Q4C56_09820, partial [Peptococcaceae bacterium]|nr:hypothetical protein [Peptococcaceae bacterium]